MKEKRICIYGRPPLPDNLRRTHRLQSYLNDDEYDIIQQLGSEKPLQALVRDLVLEAAQARLQNERKKRTKI